MSHLLAISVGPVQEFIAAARRTRDLWFGSYLLSEISRAVAISVKQQGGKLIFPASLGADNVANVILAELPKGDPESVASEARCAAQKRWREFADDAWESASGECSGVIRSDVWADQVDDVIEFYASWAPRHSNNTYPEDRVGAMRLLSGRKNCRDFLPAAGRAGLPKSSLDGQRETVLNPTREWLQHFRDRLRIREGEQLDVVGFVKRVAEGHRPYPSVSRIAADPWVRQNGHRLDAINLVCERLVTQRIIRRLDTTAYPHYVDFPYEGSVLYPSRHHELFEATIDQGGQESESLRELREALASLPEPSSYLAVLVADGDKMGAAISSLTTSDANREFSEALASFASIAQQIVQEHHGVLVYAGGDDVLAFLPVDKSLSCARKLHDAFGESMEEYNQPTLSVGIAIGHFMENLEYLLEYGRNAEKDAKHPDRDGLAIHLHKRGGAPIFVRSRWKDRLDERLVRYAELLLARAIPTKLPYELRRLADVYESWTSESVAQAMQMDVLRVIQDKQPRAGRGYLEEIERLVNEQLFDVVSLYRFAEELLVAKQIASAHNQADLSPIHIERDTQ